MRRVWLSFAYGMRFFGDCSILLIHQRGVLDLIPQLDWKVFIYDTGLVWLGCVSGREDEEELGKENRSNSNTYQCFEQST